MLVTVSAPAWLTAAQVRREVRTLIGEASMWGAQDAETGEIVEEGDIKVRRIQKGTL